MRRLRIIVILKHKQVNHFQNNAHTLRRDYENQCLKAKAMRSFFFVFLKKPAHHLLCVFFTITEIGKVAKIHKNA